jgi:hypothetical protein
VQPGEVRSPVSIAGHDLAVEHSRFGWELVQQLSDRRETLSEVVPITAVDGDSRIRLVGLHAEAIEFHLVQPDVAGGHGVGAHGAAGWDEAKRRHSLIIWRHGSAGQLRLF